MTVSRYTSHDNAAGSPFTFSSAWYSGAVPHLVGDHPGPGVPELGPRLAPGDPLPPHRGQTGLYVDPRRCVGVRAGGVVQVEVLAVGQMHAASRYAELPAIDLLRARDRTRGDGRTDRADIHHAGAPYAGITRTGSAVGGTGQVRFLVQPPSQE